MRKFRTLLVLGILVAFLYYGCSKSNPTSPTSTMGTMKVMMIDSPADYSAVNIVIDSVQAHITSSDSASGWFTLNNKQATYNLLQLVNGANAVIGEANLQAGTYSQIRLFIGEGSNLVMNGQTYSLTIPSGFQTGIKLNVDANVQAGVTYLLTLDFDANRSIVSTGSLLNLQFKLKPVIRVVTTGTTGIISGAVSPDSVSSNVWAVSGSDTVSTSTDASGGFKLQYLQSNTYSVTIAPQDMTTYKDTTISNVTVTASNTTNVGTVVLTKK